MKGKKLRFRKKEKYKNLVFAIICVSLVFIASGMALIHSTLSINGISNIAKTVWDVHFENLDAKDSNIEVVSPATIDSTDNTKINFSLNVRKPTNYYEFEVDVVNDGTIDAMFSDINVVGLGDYLYCETYYSDDANYAYGDLLAKKNRDRIKVKIGVIDNDEKDLTELFGVTSEEDILVDVSIEVKYIQSTKEAHKRKRNLLSLIKGANNWTTDLNFDFTDKTKAGETNYFIKNETMSDTYPIYYYHGAIDNNNVLFAGFCWKIVRTTEKGGIKLIYNGTSNNSVCNNTGDDTHIGMTDFSSNRNRFAYVGYMYNPETIGSDYETELGWNVSPSEINVQDSEAKSKIDTWFETNLIDYREYLEDSVWCNDRSLYDYDVPLEYGSENRVLNNTNLLIKDIEVCPSVNDRFTVNDTTIGNGSLKYEVGLLTAEEYSLAGLGHVGYNTDSYLYNGISSWTLTPSHTWTHTSITSYMFYSLGVSSWANGVLDNDDGGLGAGLRPSISLKVGTEVSGGTGTANDPYIVG